MSNASIHAQYERLALPKSRFGARCHALGWRLVETFGITPSSVVWDADEVIWDWLMDATHMGSRLHRTLLRRDIGHREYFRLKPGVLELAWGMHDAAVARGLDPWMRIWTNGYPWRIWRLTREIPGLTALLGGPSGPDADDPEWVARSPRLFTRLDFVAFARSIADQGAREARLQEASPTVAALVRRQWEHDPFDSSFKVPELASWVGKDGFREARFLVDDRRVNCDRFVASGRTAIHVHSPSPRILFGKVPNTVWSRPSAWLERLTSPLGLAIGAALERASEAPSVVHDAVAMGDVDDWTPHDWTVDIPDERLRTEWIDPIAELRRLYGRASGSRVPGRA